MTSHLTVDAGNSQLCIVLYLDSVAVRTERISTRPFLTSRQIAELWLRLLAELELEPSSTHLSISSVVPDYNSALKEASKSLNCASFHWVDAESPHGFQLAASVRQEIGADLLAGLVGARGKTEGAVVVVDCGTATTFALLTADNRVMGVAILPGVKTQLKTLMESAPHLAESMDLVPPPQAFGRNTVEALQSGILYGHAETIEGLIRRYRGLPGFEEVQVFGCGGLFMTLAALCPSVTRSETHLVNQGCLILSQRQLQEAI